MSSRLLCAPLALALLAGCDTVNRQTGSIDPGFGEAVKYDMAIQVIDPDPVYSEDDAQPGDNGAKAAAAMKRYRTDQVKDVESQATTEAVGGSGPQ